MEIKRAASRPAYADKAAAAPGKESMNRPCLRKKSMEKITVRARRRMSGAAGEVTVCLYE